ncbi:hypothetical protein niasHT_025454 [Heterodera trifolii]|uniref:DUF659 domain-containing protein n=1 Tax=Heterodera trifolii TaxID=157864 RepID=A0ABD2JWZ5_9BILA
MPKIQSKSAFIRDWIKKVEGEEIYSINGKIIFCQVCEQQIPCSQYCHLKQHNETAKHRANLDRFSKKKSKQHQPFLTTNENKQDQFSADLCKALVSANIPFFKLNNSVLSSFLEKYCQRNVPDESTLRKNYLAQLFSETMTKIKDDISDAFVWVSVDETTDKMGRMMANLLIGKLDGKKWHRPHLISVKALEKVDSGAMARFVNEGLDSFSGDIKKERVLFLVTDGAAYMKKAGKQLKVFYTNLLHVTCLCHALHRVAEKVRDEFAQVDKLISKTKQVFLKAPQRLSVYREMCPGLSIPPRPVLTRWTTWITAVSFYWEHFEALKAVVNSFNSDDAVCIKECQLTFNNSVWQDLAYIHSNFGQLATAITKLETQGMTIFDAMDVFAGVHNQMDNVYGEKANEIRKKFADIVAKNHGIEKISQFCQILSGKNTESDVSPNLIPFYKFAPLTSCDVERSFSVYKSMLADNQGHQAIGEPSSTVCFHHVLHHSQPFCSPQPSSLIHSVVLNRSIPLSSTVLIHSVVLSRLIHSVVFSRPHPFRSVLIKSIVLTFFRIHRLINLSSSSSSISKLIHHQHHLSVNASAYATGGTSTKRATSQKAGTSGTSTMGAASRLEPPAEHRPWARHLRRQAPAEHRPWARHLRRQAPAEHRPWARHLRRRHRRNIDPRRGISEGRHRAEHRPWARHLRRQAPAEHRPWARHLRRQAPAELRPWARHLRRRHRRNIDPGRGISEGRHRRNIDPGRGISEGRHRRNFDHGRGISEGRHRRNIDHGRGISEGRHRRNIDPGRGISEGGTGGTSTLGAASQKAGTGGTSTMGAASQKAGTGGTSTMGAASQKAGTGGTSTMGAASQKAGTGGTSTLGAASQKAGTGGTSTMGAASQKAGTGGTSTMGAASQKAGTGGTSTMGAASQKAGTGGTSTLGAASQKAGTGGTSTMGAASQKAGTGGTSTMGAASQKAGTGGTSTMGAASQKAGTEIYPIYCIHMCIILLIVVP